MMKNILNGTPKWSKRIKTDQTDQNWSKLIKTIKTDTKCKLIQMIWNDTKRWNWSFKKVWDCRIQFSLNWELRQYKNGLVSVKIMFYFEIAAIIPPLLHGKWKRAAISKSACISQKRIRSYIVLALDAPFFAGNRSIITAVYTKVER